MQVSVPVGLHASEQLDLQRFSIGDCACHLALASAAGTGDRIPHAARPSSGRIASGRGLTAEQAERSCRGEFAELLGACRWGDEDTVRRPLRDVGPQALHPAGLLLVSDGQYRDRRQWNALHGPRDWLPRRLLASEVVDWVEAVAPDRRDRALVPAAFVYIGWFEPGDDVAFTVADSNGCAAQASVEGAMAAGFLELVERDACALWWHGGHPRPSIDLARVEGAGDLIVWLAERERRTVVLDLTTDLGVPVRAAVSTDPDGRAVAVGAAAHFDANQAAISALTEMLQGELPLLLRRSMPTPPGDPLRFWLETASLDRFPHLKPMDPMRGSASYADPSGYQSSLDRCLAICRRHDLRFLTIDLTRPSLGFQVVRVVVPGLRPLRTRLAPGRLFDVPPRLGWCAPKEVNGRINSVPLPV